MANNLEKSAISATYLKVIFDALDMRGVDIKRLREAAQISEALMNSPDDFINVGQYQKLMTLAKKETQDPALGLYLGKFFEVGTHGVLAYAALGMPTVWECLKLGEKFARVRSPMLNVKLSFDQDEAVISFDTNCFVGEVYQIVIEGGICSYYAILNIVFEEQVPKAKISVRYPKPARNDEYEQMFSEEIVFNCDKNEIRLPRQAVEKPLLTANPFLAEEVDRQFEELLKSVEEESLIEQVKQLLKSSMGFIPSQESIASKLNMSTRSLRRKLKESETSFQVLLNEVRRELAIQYLRDTEWGIEEIAYLLGFSSAPHFSHAFKKWTGSAPKYYREAQLELSKSSE